MNEREKWDRLRELLISMDRVVVAFSGGVDSSVLLAEAAEALGSRVLAVTAVSETYPSGELADARELADRLGVRHQVISTEELSHEEFASNPPDRCYFCKQELFATLRKIAEKEGNAWVLDGSNADDMKDHRPGRRAAAECSVRSPLLEAGLTKHEIRSQARNRDLPAWNKPPLACLASRIPYGTRITPKVLQTIQAAEDILMGLGFSGVRVRHHGDTARIELDRGDFPRVIAGDMAERITRALKDLGYTYVCLDLEGYRTGSMNEGILSSSRRSRT